MPPIFGMFILDTGIESNGRGKILIWPLNVLLTYWIATKMPGQIFLTQKKIEERTRKSALEKRIEQLRV